MPPPEPPNKRLRLSGPSGEAARTPQACTSCRERKIKCCGSQPCRYCSKRGLNCTFPDNVQKKMYSVAYVKELEQRLSSTLERTPYSNHSLSCQADSNLVQTEPSPGDVTNTASPIIPESAMSSSLNFGSRIRSLPPDPAVASIGSSRNFYESPDNVYNLEPNATPAQSNRNIVSWPSEEEAHELLASVLTSIGGLQHLIDPRSVSDKLSTFYEADLKESILDDLSHVEILMVFALGGLLQGKLKEGSSFPGAEYFLEAVDRLPSLCTLRKAGTLAVEIIGLFAFFLQCSDRKDDAYVYAGVALRLAISNGLARGLNTQPMKRSEKTHRIRLWWTIYMQERRLAAATGNPVGILDGNISTMLPSESPGFPPVAALNVNIKLARLTGQIIQDVYSPTPRTERQFLQRVHDLVAKLADVGKKVPLEHAIDFSKPLVVTRTGATLYLMLFQGKILTTRPILLHLAKSRLEGNTLDDLSPAVMTLQKLAATCIEAAGMGLDVLRSLQRQNLIANFGYFDLDAAVSAAFVFVLVESMHTKDSPRSGFEGIRGATEILQYLIKRGNKAAEKRLLDVEQLCQHLNIHIEAYSRPESPRIEGTQPANTQRVAPENSITEGIHIEETLIDPGVVEGIDDFMSTPDWRQALLPPLDLESLPNGLQFNPMDGNVLAETSFDNFNGFNFDFSNEFILTGADETDWEEFERQIARHR
ncbi:hypothetical protein IQ07DRAFT_543394 [Pyrenochaeta sp. DS3sAY3a]|nr:hypothetical protein IQ07DRAFT_543394 [Pyrenochaeta sp. DS3sAY3a]